MESNDDSPRFEPIDRHQVILEPLDIELLIPRDHPARKIWDLLGRMDLSRFSARIKRGVDYYGSWANRTAIRMKHGIDEGYHPSAFQYDEMLNVLVCPEGRHLEFRTIQKLPGGLENHVFTAKREDCRTCPKRALCTPQNAMKVHGRAVSVRLEPEPMRRYHEKMATDAGRAIYRLRSAVAEFPHAWLKDKLKWVRVKCRGVAKVQAEALWVCLTYNLQRYFKLRQLAAA